MQVVSSFTTIKNMQNDMMRHPWITMVKPVEHAWQLVAKFHLLTFLTKYLRCEENLRAQHPVLRLLSSDSSEGSGEGGGVDDGLLGAPL